MPIVKRQYHIDLGEPPDTRWNKMIRAERKRGRRLIENCMESLEEYANLAPLVGGLMLKGVKKSLNRIVKAQKDPTVKEYWEDAEVWADGLGLKFEDLVTANLVYEVAQAGGYFNGLFNSVSRSLGFCTAVAYNLPKGAVAHVRNMDWPLKDCGAYSCVIHYKGAPGGSFTTLGWPGYVGVLSGVAPGRFSATINQAPQSNLTSAQWPASFALRYNFENSNSFDEAVTDLKATNMAAAALFLVAGTKKNQAAVVEHCGSKASVRKMKDGALAVANHYESKALRSRNDDDTEDSKERMECAEEHPYECGGQLASLDDFPAYHSLTCQQMVMVPKSGVFKAWYQNTNRAIAEDE